MRPIGLIRKARFTVEGGYGGLYLVWPGPPHHEASLDQARGVILLLSGGSGLLMAAYCLTLPSTPPKPARSARFAPWAIIKLLERRDFRALVIVSLLTAKPAESDWREFIDD